MSSAVLVLGILMGTRQNLYSHQTFHSGRGGLVVCWFILGCIRLSSLSSSHLSSLKPFSLSRQPQTPALFSGNRPCSGVRSPCSSKVCGCHTLCHRSRKSIGLMSKKVPHGLCVITDDAGAEGQISMETLVGRQHGA